MLSNNHALVQNNRYAVNILQPGPDDGGKTSDFVGRTSEYVPYTTGANYMDAAIGRPTSNSILNPRYLISSTGDRLVLRGHLLSYPVGIRLYKSGRTTGFTTGVVTSIAWNGYVGGRLFVNQTVIQGSGAGLGGDSGAVWITNDRYAAALHHGGSSTGLLSISTPIARVMQTFNIRVAAPANTTSGFKAGAVKGAAPKGKFSYVQPLTENQWKKIRVAIAQRKPRTR